MKEIKSTPRLFNPFKEMTKLSGGTKNFTRLSTDQNVKLSTGVVLHYRRTIIKPQLENSYHVTLVTQFRTL